MPWWILLFVDELVFGAGFWAARKLGVTRFFARLARRSAFLRGARLWFARTGAVAFASRLFQRSGIPSLFAGLSRRGGRLLAFASKRGGKALSLASRRGGRLLAPVVAALA